MCDFFDKLGRAIVLFLVLSPFILPIFVFTWKEIRGDYD
jgi:hypothetical protein